MIQCRENFQAAAEQSLFGADRRELDKPIQLQPLYLPHRPSEFQLSEAKTNDFSRAEQLAEQAAKLTERQAEIHDGNIIIQGEVVDV